MPNEQVMTFLVALLSWVLLSIPAALILGRIVAGSVAERHEPVGIGPSGSARHPVVRA